MMTKWICKDCEIPCYYESDDDKSVPRYCGVGGGDATWVKITPSWTCDKCFKHCVLINSEQPHTCPYEVECPDWKYNDTLEIH